jgi:hypothetical protein
MKPEDHRESCVVAQDTEYKVPEGRVEESNASSGTLHCGRVVWIQRKLSQCQDEPAVSAYAEGIGVIEIDPNRLKETR